MNDLVTLEWHSNNAVGVCVVGVPPGENPYGPLAQWLATKGHKYPFQEAERYEFVDTLIEATPLTGVILAFEFLDGDLFIGPQPATKYD